MYILKFALKHIHFRTGQQNEILQHFDIYQYCDSEGMAAGEVVVEAHQCGEFSKWHHFTVMSL